MTKGIEWLKDEILTDMQYLEGNREIRQLDIKYQTLREVVQKINYLDEPKTLSQEWIDENEVFIFDLDDDCEIRYVPSLKLRHLLVPKQEELEVKIQVLIERYRNEDGKYSNPENAWIDEFINDLEELKTMSLETETNENVHNSDHLISVYNEAYETFYKQSGQMNSDRAHEFALAAVFIIIHEKETDE